MQRVKNSLAACISLTRISSLWNTGVSQSEVTKEETPKRFNYASFNAGAKVLASNDGAQNAKSLLSESLSSYTSSPCSVEDKYLVIALSEDILMDTFSIVNAEYYSSTFENFQITGSTTYPTSNWVEIGSFTAQNIKKWQTFKLEEPNWVRYLKIEFNTHFDNEYYCTISSITVNGESMLESFKNDLTQTKLELQDFSDHISEEMDSDDHQPTPHTPDATNQISDEDQSDETPLHLEDPLPILELTTQSPDEIQTISILESPEDTLMQSSKGFTSDFFIHEELTLKPNESLSLELCKDPQVEMVEVDFRTLKMFHGPFLRNLPQLSNDDDFEDGNQQEGYYYGPIAPRPTVGSNPLTVVDRSAPETVLGASEDGLLCAAVVPLEFLAYSDTVCVVKSRPSQATTGTAANKAKKTVSDSGPNCGAEKSPKNGPRRNSRQRKRERDQIYHELFNNLDLNLKKNFKTVQDEIDKRSTSIFKVLAEQIKTMSMNEEVIKTYVDKMNGSYKTIFEMQDKEFATLETMARQQAARLKTKTSELESEVKDMRVRMKVLEEENSTMRDFMKSFMEKQEQLEDQNDNSSSFHLFSVLNVELSFTLLVFLLVPLYVKTFIDILTPAPMSPRAKFAGTGRSRSEEPVPAESRSQDTSGGEIRKEHLDAQKPIPEVTSLLDLSEDSIEESQEYKDLKVKAGSKDECDLDVIQNQLTRENSGKRRNSLSPGRIKDTETEDFTSFLRSGLTFSIFLKPFKNLIQVKDRETTVARPLHSVRKHRKMYTINTTHDAEMMTPLVRGRRESEDEFTLDFKRENSFRRPGQRDRSDRQ
eukprot:CAMPEP_0114997614 /NCGR_PEP_ID=MMETSP0216-20121206/15001_1 /TAXON_ID=223996 /ORGANISM="Protocruzia adherens, Strain Boccale" /LENGTH=818 /DNA_ID=CAMNT_0002362023 /DNA_START=1816 /DNA_END=4272 /DNA_ORIENTATION=+